MISLCRAVFLTFVPLLSLTAVVQCFLLFLSPVVTELTPWSQLFPHSCSLLQLSDTGHPPVSPHRSHPCSPLTTKTICLFGLQCLLNTHSFVRHPQWSLCKIQKWTLKVKFMLHRLCEQSFLTYDFPLFSLSFKLRQCSVKFWHLHLCKGGWREGGFKSSKMASVQF